jgi:hypothetical protein
MTAWLDGASVFRRDRATHFTSHDQNVRLDLRRGENRLLVKVLGGGAGFGFGFRCLGRAELLEGIKDLPDKDPGPPPLVGVNDKIDWNRSLKPPAEHFLNPLWKRLAGDFTTAAVRRQMDWERRDGIWDYAWAKGSVRELAMRYPARCDGEPKTAAQKLAAAAKTHADLEAVRQVYYTSKRIAHAPDDDAYESLRLAIEDLLRTFGDRYPKGQQFLDRAESLRQTMVKAMPDARRGDAAASAAFDRASDDYAEVRQEALLANPLLAFDKLLLVKRFTGYSIPDYHNGNEPGQPANFQQNCSMAAHGYNNEIAVLSPVRPDGKLVALYRSKDTAFVGDVDLHWDANRMLFSSIGAKGRWHVFEVGSDGKGLRQVSKDSSHDIDNYDACYLPNGRIVFGSTATYQGVPCTAGSDHVSNLHLMNADGGGVRRLCFDQDQNWHPSVMHDGRILYSRWEYSDLQHINGRQLMSMNPDGSNQKSVYKSNSWFPPGLFFGASAPDSSKVVAIAGGHHGGKRKGYLTVLDPAISHYEADGITYMLPPGRGKGITAARSDAYNHAKYPAAIHPFPLSDRYFLVACRPTWDRPFGIYLTDVFDNMVLIHEDAEYALFEPIPLTKRPIPPVIPDSVDLTRRDATVYIADIYRGPGLAGVPRGIVKSMRLYSLDFGYRNHVDFKKQNPFDVRAYSARCRCRPTAQPSSEFPPTRRSRSSPSMNGARPSS